MEHADTSPRRSSSSSYRIVKLSQGVVARAQKVAEVSEALGEEKRKAIKADVHRGKSITDDFEKHVLEGTEMLMKYWTAYQEEHGTVKRRRGLTKKTEDVTHEVMIQKFNVLIHNCELWMKTRAQEGDERREAKREACRQYIEVARKGLEEVRRRQAEDHFAELQPLVQAGQATRGQVGAYREADARLIAAQHGLEDAGGGTSEGIKLIKDGTGKVAYAFKPLSGESSQMNAPKGAGTVREALASRFFEAMDGQCQIGFGWPKTSLAILQDGGKSGGIGALIEGLPGKPCDDPSVDPRVLQAVPKKTVQTMLLGNLASMQLDAKLGNAFIDTSGAQPDLRPSDGGAIAPSPDMLAEQCGRGVVVGSGFLNQFNACGSTALGEPFAPEVRAEFLKIRVRELQAAIDEELLECKAKGLDPEALDVVKGCATMVRGVEYLQRILTREPNITPEELMNKFHQEYVLPLAQERHLELEELARPKVLALHKKFPWLVATHEEFITFPGNSLYTLQEMEQMFGSPTEFALLEHCKKLGEKKLLECGVMLPLRTKPSVQLSRIRKKYPNFAK
jgi:hypothetical protein